VAQRPVVVDFREAEVLERHVAQAIQCGVDASASRPDILE
jgi:hypothetical protein